MCDKNSIPFFAMVWLILFTQLSMDAYAELEAMPPGLELRIALSAAPPHIREAAETYILDPNYGYKLAQKGSNGFACLVIRTAWKMPKYRDDIVIPICWDAQGVDTHMPVALDVASLRAKGRSKKELIDIINKNYSSGKYRAPTKNGIAPMLSPIFRNYGGETEPRLINYPHLMFYAPGVSNADIGGASHQHPNMPWVLDEGAGGPHALIIVRIGDTEVKKINEEHKALFKEFCDYKAQWCN